MKVVEREMLLYWFRRDMFERKEKVRKEKNQERMGIGVCACASFVNEGQSTREEDKRRRRNKIGGKGRGEDPDGIGISHVLTLNFIFSELVLLRLSCLNSNSGSPLLSNFTTCHFCLSHWKIKSKIQVYPAFLSQC